MARKQSPKRPPAGSRRGVGIAVAVAVVVVGIGIFFAMRSTTQTAGSSDAAKGGSSADLLSRKVVLPAIPRRPRRPTMDPGQFTDPPIRQSYEIARNNPDLLEQMPCYCGCYANPGHTNNLDCFWDRHGET